MDEKAQKQPLSAQHAGGVLRVASRIKTAILALFLAVPCTWIAISVSDNVTVSDSVRYILSPGTMLGRHVSMQPTHSWHEMGDRLSQWIAIAFFTDMAFYTMLIFGVVTITRALKNPK
jgi:hypothetical protein